MLLEEAANERKLQVKSAIALQKRKVQRKETKSLNLARAALVLKNELLPSNAMYTDFLNIQWQLSKRRRRKY